MYLGGEKGGGDGIPLDKPGPRRRGICFIKESEARKASYLRASFLMSFLFLLSFLRSSEDMASMPWCLERSMSCWSPRTLRKEGGCESELRWERGEFGEIYQMLIPGRGTDGRRTVPELGGLSVELLDVWGRVRTIACLAEDHSS